MHLILSEHQNLTQDRLQFVPEFYRLSLFHDLLVHFAIKKARRHSNIHGCFNLISSQDPYLYSRVFHELDSIGNFVLKSVLDGCGSDDLQVSFYLFINSSYFFLSTGHSKFRLLRLFSPLLVEFRVDILLSKIEGSKTFCSVLIDHLLGIFKYFRVFRLIGKSLSYHSVSPFTHKQNLAIRLSENDAHALSCA